MPATKDHDQDQAITWTAVGKWAGFIITILTIFTSCILAFANLKADTALIRADMATFRRDMEARKDYVDKRLSEHDQRMDRSDKSVVELQTKLERCLTILERIDKKITPSIAAVKEMLRETAARLSLLMGYVDDAAIKRSNADVGSISPRP